MEIKESKATAMEFTAPTPLRNGLICWVTWIGHGDKGNGLAKFCSIRHKSIT